jgi:hypothetical protein
MKNYFTITIVAILLSSCAQGVGITRGVQYAQMYEEKPTSIVIMPPINQTNSVEAKEFFYTTLYMPLSEKGYYVFSPYLTMEMLQSESAYDSEMFLESDLGNFNRVLGADAAIFTIIKSWDRNSLLGYLTVGVEYVLRSTATGETLYHREGLIQVDTSVNGGGGGLVGSLVNMAATAITTAMTDKVVAGRKCNAFVLSDMPVGKYNAAFGQDSEVLAGAKFIKATVK